MINDTTQQLLEPDQYYAPTGKKIPQKIIKKDSSPIALADYSNKLQTRKTKLTYRKTPCQKFQLEGKYRDARFGDEFVFF